MRRKVTENNLYLFKSNWSISIFKYNLSQGLKQQVGKRVSYHALRQVAQENKALSPFVNKLKAPKWYILSKKDKRWSIGNFHEGKFSFTECMYNCAA